MLKHLLNIVIVLASVALIGPAAIRPSRWPAEADAPRLRPAGRPAQYVHGDRLPRFPGVDYSTSARTIVVFIGTRCQYCINNMEFYRALAADRKSRAFQLIVAGPEPVDALNTFLRQYSLNVDGVVSVSAGEVRVVGTPTLVLADRKGVVERVWVGEQGPAGRAQIVALAGDAKPI